MGKMHWKMYGKNALENVWEKCIEGFEVVAQFLENFSGKSKLATEGF